MERVCHTERNHSVIFFVHPTNHISSSIEGSLIVFCGSVPTLKPVYDRFVQLTDTLKGKRFTFLSDWTVQPENLNPDRTEEKDWTKKHSELHGIQQLAPVHRKTKSRRIAHGLLEVGLWSSHGTKTANNTQNQSMDDGRGMSSVEERIRLCGPDTSHQLV